MGSGDLSTDLSLGLLTPTPAVRAVEGGSSNQDAEGQARRRPRPEEEKQEEDALCEAVDQPAHQLDHLARNYETAIHSRRARRTSQQSLEQPWRNGGAEIARASLALVGEPEGSLQASQEALLSRDVARLEGCMREQSRLRRSLEILGSQDAGTRRESIQPSQFRSSSPICFPPTFIPPTFANTIFHCAIWPWLPSCARRSYECCISGWSKRGCSFGHNGG